MEFDWQEGQPETADGAQSCRTPRWWTHAHTQKYQSRFLIFLDLECSFFSNSCIQVYSCVFDWNNKQEHKDLKLNIAKQKGNLHFDSNWSCQKGNNNNQLREYWITASETGHHTGSYFVFVFQVSDENSEASHPAEGPRCPAVFGKLRGKNNNSF